MLIQTLLQIVYFYNPLLWWANSQIRRVREQAVDEMVLVAMGEQAEDYPETLLQVSQHAFNRPAFFRAPIKMNRHSSGFLFVQLRCQAEIGPRRWAAPSAAIMPFGLAGRINARFRCNSSF